MSKKNSDATVFVVSPKEAIIVGSVSVYGGTHRESYQSITK